MRAGSDKIHYKRNMQIAVIISLFLVIAAFIFSPHTASEEETLHYFSEPIITIADIPSTNQENNLPPVPPRPVLVTPSELEEIEYPDILLDVEISAPKKLDNNGDGSGFVKGKTFEFSSLPFIPRQIIEVVPKDIKGAEGTIKISLKINREGYVTEHKILFNRSNKDECLSSVIQAVYKSRWQPITIDGEKIEYWLEKSYQFN